MNTWYELLLFQRWGYRFSEMMSPTQNHVLGERQTISVLLYMQVLNPARGQRVCWRCLRKRQNWWNGAGQACWCIVKATLCPHFSKHLFLFIWLCWFLLATCGIFFCCVMWELVPQPGIEPKPPALGVQSLSHWTTREVPCGLICGYIKLLAL